MLHWTGFISILKTGCEYVDAEIWHLILFRVLIWWGCCSSSNRTFTHFMLFCMFLDSLISIKNKHEKYWNLKELCGMLGNVLNHFVAVCVTSVCQLQQMIKKKREKKTHIRTWILFVCDFSYILLNLMDTIMCKVIRLYRLILCAKANFSWL